tara:strand:+ start:239 stop:589 length:351 start_codon:yes stop_codon:yes gene_type:complete
VTQARSKILRATGRARRAQQERTAPTTEIYAYSVRVGHIPVKDQKAAHCANRENIPNRELLNASYVLLENITELKKLPSKRTVLLVQLEPMETTADSQVATNAQQTKLRQKIVPTF